MREKPIKKDRRELLLDDDGDNNNSNNNNNKEWTVFVTDLFLLSVHITFYAVSFH
jgi:hypothetical protein